MSAYGGAMAEDDALADRRRTIEEDYFRKKDRELIEKMRQAEAADQVRRDLAVSTGLSDPDLLRDLEELGFTPETVGLLPLVPIVQMAWAEGSVTSAERNLLLKLARSRGITEGSAPDRKLGDWLERQPAPEVFSRATRLIRAMLENVSAEQGGLTADDLIRYCEEIAAASGGILGIGRISAEERATLAQIAAELKTRGQ
jgi:hypothetical protein